MRFELLTLLIILLFFVFMLAEILGLYYLSDKQEKETKEYRKKYDICMSMMETIMYAPTDFAKTREIDALVQMAQSDETYMETITYILLTMSTETEKYPEKKRNDLKTILKAVDPAPYYQKMLREGDLTKKGYACQRLSELGVSESTEEIRELLNQKNRRVQYAAGISLATLGEKEDVVKYLLGIQNDYRYSYRIINEIIDRYKGDRKSLAEELLDKGDNYLRSCVIKSVGKYNLEELVPYIAECTNDTNINIKISATKALVYCAKQEHIVQLIRLSKDQNWVVRVSAVRALGNFDTLEAVEAVKKAVQDKEWWVRQAAAETLIKMDSTLEHVEGVITGYDRYASEAVKHSLYKVLNMEEKS